MMRVPAMMSLTVPGPRGKKRKKKEMMSLKRTKKRKKKRVRKYAIMVRNCTVQSQMNDKLEQLADKLTNMSMTQTKITSLVVQASSHREFEKPSKETEERVKQVF